MTSFGWNPWKITAIGLGLVAATALIVGIAVANWSGYEGTQKARESYLYRQLANQKAVLESQRRIYMDRFRRLEAELRQREQDVAVLSERVIAMQSQRSNEIEARVISHHVQGQSRSPFTGGTER